MGANLGNEGRNSTKLKLECVSNLAPLNAMKEIKKECLNDDSLLNEENVIMYPSNCALFY
jgi:CO dehydrogenase/acetyl-CoA synthase delta subunit